MSELDAPGFVDPRVRVRALARVVSAYWPFAAAAAVGIGALVLAVAASGTR